MVDDRRLPPLPPRTILLVEVGSTSHGTGIPGGEDLDLLGVVVEEARAVLGLGRDDRTVMQRTQPEGVRSGPGDVDRTLVPLRKFLRLAAAGNPSLLQALWAPVVQSTSLGDDLRRLAPGFVGRHVIPRYRGYMQGQTLRLLGLRGNTHGRRGGGGREPGRNGYDTKYAMHAARLGVQCIELLHTRRLTMPMEGERANWLRAVRNDEVPFDEWWRVVLDLDEQMARLLDDLTIPSGPNDLAIESWSVATHLAVWGR